jgi:beta-glucosidase
MLYDESGKYVGSVDYNDSRWNDLLDEIPLSEMKSLIGAGAFTTIAVSGVDGIVAKPVTNDEDGPCGFTNFVSGSVVYGTCSYMAECVMGSTWNIDLAYQMGVMVGEEGLIGNADGDGLPYSGWYAPAINIHRSQFAGRNWEYYSEDSLLSGKLAANVVKGAMSKGVYTYVKHFAVNDQETDREYNGILVWANEQSMREIYLRAFEITVKEGGTTAMMSSFNRLGTTWAGGSYALLTSVLRNEWGFQGMVITDWSTNNYTHIDEMIRAGGDLFLAMDPKSFGMTDDATQVTLLRQATKNILYTVANSNVMSLNVSGYSLPMWQIVMIVIDVGIVVLCAAWGVWAILSAKKKDKKAE